MQNYLLKQFSVVNEGQVKVCDVYLRKGRIERIDPSVTTKERVIEIDGTNLHLLPGVIDDQVHFRDPGLTHKASIFTESRAAVAGGVTSFMDMPNTIPNALSASLLEEKYSTAARDAIINYSFFMGTSNDNADEVLKMNKRKNEVCGIKIFMGSSTGNMLVDDESSLSKIFSEAELLIATHCEDEATIKSNYARLKNEKSELEPTDHPKIRSVEACYKSSAFAIALAKKFNTRLHILHISTAKELELFRNDIPLKEKQITNEVCVHHLHFTSDDYRDLGYLIKCNPAIKEPGNKAALWEGLLTDKLDIIATDHAPHLLSEKEPPYEHAHSGLPLVQHSLLLMLDYVKKGEIPLERVAEKMSHSVAGCFQIKARGFIREGYFADLVVVDLNARHTVAKDNVFYKCGWSPLEGKTFPAQIKMTFVNGNLAFDASLNEKWNENIRGQRMLFTR